MSASRARLPKRLPSPPNPIIVVDAKTTHCAAGYPRWGAGHIIVEFYDADAATLRAMNPPQAAGYTRWNGNSGNQVIVESFDAPATIRNMSPQQSAGYTRITGQVIP